MAEGGAEFCITSVRHYLTAWSEAGELPARFVAVIGQRHTIGGLVRVDADAASPQGLASLRLGGQEDNSLVLSFQAGLARLGLPPCELIPCEDPALALGQGVTDVIAATVDTVRRNERQAGVALQPIPLNVDVYMSGLVAGDGVPAEVVERMRAALVRALELQRANPKAGLTALLDRYPDVDADDALDGWLAVEPFIFTDRPVGSMTSSQWRETVAHTAQTAQLPHVDAASVFRSEFCEVER